MHDRDQKLIFEAYQVINEDLKAEEVLTAILTMWGDNVNNIPGRESADKLDKRLEQIFDASNEEEWRQAIELLKDTARLPDEQIEQEFISNWYSNDRTIIVGKMEQLIEPDIPKLPKSDKPSFQQQFGHLQASPDDIPETAMDSERAKALTDDLIDKFDLQWMKEPNNWNARDRIQMVIKSLIENKFEVHEPVLHYEDDNEIVWLLGDEMEMGKYAKLTIGLDDDEVLVAKFETNATRDGDDFVTRASLDNDTHISILIDHIRDTGKKINDDDDDDEGVDPWDSALNA